MDLSSGFDLTVSEINRLYLLDWIYDNGGSAVGSFVYIGPLLEDREEEAARSAVADLRAPSKRTAGSVFRRPLTGVAGRAR